MKVLNNLTALQRVSGGEVNNEPSMTIPDDSMSIKEILDRYARGLPLGGERVPVYNGEEYIPDLETLDLVDRAELMEMNSNRIKELQNSQKDETTTISEKTPKSVGDEPNVPA